MPFTLDQVVPWGRSMAEYVSMFALSAQDLEANILSCADGPASFNAEMNASGRTVVSVDPLYQFTAEEIRGRIDAVFPTVMEQIARNLDDYVWTAIPSPEAWVRSGWKPCTGSWRIFPREGKRDGICRPLCRPSPLPT